MAKLDAWVFACSNFFMGSWCYSKLSSNWKLYKFKLSLSQDLWHVHISICAYLFLCFSYLYSNHISSLFFKNVITWYNMISTGLHNSHQISLKYLLPFLQDREDEVNIYIYTYIQSISLNRNFSKQL